MFCNNCGAQLPDGTKFCKYCGTPQPNAEFEAYSYNDVSDAVPPVSPVPPIPPAPPQVPYPPQQPPLQTPNEPKKNSNALIIAIVAVFLVVALVVTGVILIINKNKTAVKGEETTATTTVPTLSEVTAGGKEEESTTEKTSEEASEPSETSSEPSSEPKTDPTPSSPGPRLTDAEQIASEYCTAILEQDFFGVCDNEILEFSEVCNLIDLYLMESSGISSKKELYEMVSEEIGMNIDDAEDLLTIAVTTTFTEESLISNYGSDYRVNCKITDSAFAEKSEISEYVNSTKQLIEVYMPANVVDWDAIEKYAIVSVDAEIGGSVGRYSANYTMLLGCLNGKWKVIYSEENGTENGLLSLVLLDGIYSDF